MGHCSCHWSCPWRCLVTPPIATRIDAGRVQGYKLRCTYFASNRTWERTIVSSGTWSCTEMSGHGRTCPEQPGRTIGTPIGADLAILTRRARVRRGTDGSSGTAMPCIANTQRSNEYTILRRMLGDSSGSTKTSPPAKTARNSHSSSSGGSGTHLEGTGQSNWRTTEQLMRRRTRQHRDRCTKRWTTPSSRRIGQGDKTCM
jgi:hypothetical protein